MEFMRWTWWYRFINTTTFNGNLVGFSAGNVILKRTHTHFYDFDSGVEPPQFSVTNITMQYINDKISFFFLVDLDKWNEIYFTMNSFMLRWNEHTFNDTDQILIFDLYCARERVLGSATKTEMDIDIQLHFANSIVNKS